MITKTKTVYYCEYCGRHRLAAGAIKGHESGCTLNPRRVCKWHEKVWKHSARVLARWVRLSAVDRYATKEIIDAIHDEVEGCPACMLSALRQSGVEYHCNPDGTELWAYEEEVKEFRQYEREEEDRAEFESIQAGWL